MNQYLPILTTPLTEVDAQQFDPTMQWLPTLQAWVTPGHLNTWFGFGQSFIPWLEDPTDFYDRQQAILCPRTLNMVPGHRIGYSSGIGYADYAAVQPGPKEDLAGMDWQ